MTSDGSNLWQHILRESSVRSKLPTATLLVVGDAESGKAALLSRLDDAVPATKDQPSQPPQQHAVDTLLAYSTINVIDPKAKESGGDASDDVIAKIHTWRLNELNVKDLIRIAVKPATLKHTVIAIVLDLSRPWMIKSSLDQWSSALEGELLQQINQLPIDARQELYGAIKQHILNYEDPVRIDFGSNFRLEQRAIDRSGPVPMEISGNEFMQEGVLAKNLGVPLVLVVAKADLRPENSVKMDYIEYVLRQFAIKYGAALFYTSAKTGTNIDALRKYVLHRAYPSQFKFAHSAQLVERGAILVPAGYDSFELVDQSLLGSQPRWTSDKPFEKMVPAPHEDAEDPAALLAADIRVDSHDRWLEKLEKAAGAGLEELQKQSVEASKKAEAAAAARRAAADRRKREDKDVSSKHLANFFNNLLSRPEKAKSSRSIGDLKKKDPKSDVKSLAEQELQNLSKRATPGGNP